MDLSRNFRDIRWSDKVYTPQELLGVQYPTYVIIVRGNDSHLDLKKGQVLFSVIFL